jgi:protein ImuB
MPRVLCVWFPRWPIQRLRNERPDLRRSDLILFARQSQRLSVTVCGRRAERRGVRVGQPLAEAKALVPKAVFLPADAAADRQALRLLAIDGQRFSPLVGVEEGIRPESLLYDVTGCTHLWEGEERFLRAASDYWVAREYLIRLALAGTVGAAWALARATAAAVVPAGEEVAALSGLPVALLRLPTDVLERLNAIGLGTIGDLLQLPRETLAGRFDSILTRRMDEALGRRPELFVVERLSEPLTAFHEWDEPLDDRLAVAHLCRQMLRTLLSGADHPGAGLQELEGELRTEAGAVTLEIRLVEPSRDERHLAQLVELQLERCAWPGGVVAIRWTVLRLGRLPQVQGDWLDDDAGADTSRQVVTLVDRLSSRLGNAAVLRSEVLPDAQPERAVGLVPWSGARPGKAEEYSLPPDQSRCRPIRLLADPRPIAVVSIVPDGPPVRVTWERQDYRVVRYWGPERIATGWWRALDVQRDYYRAEWEDGTHAWIFRDRRDGRWFLHGFFE